jgi:hypothetical protein
LVYTDYRNGGLLSLQWSLKNKMKSLVFKTDKNVRPIYDRQQSADSVEKVGLPVDANAELPHVLTLN